MKSLIVFLAVCLLISPSEANGKEKPKVAPDLTKDINVDRELTYNLGATGLRGWIFTKPEDYFESQQGRTTAQSRQILVTHVGKKSPADGVIKVDDVILGAGGKMFTDDARVSIALAIQEAEKKNNQGVLSLAVWRSGKVENLTIKLQVMGAYSETAPYECAKSKLIFDNACVVLEKEPLKISWSGAITGLALLATGEAKYLSRLKEFAHKLGPKDLKLGLKDGMVVWDWGYRNLFLCEYFLLTGDREVLPAIGQYTIVLAKGQSMYGTFGHGLSRLTTDGQLHGSIPPYGPVNAAGLIGNMAIVMGKKCGIKDPEIDPAIERGSKFFSYFVDKGSIPYGEHMPWPNHDNNGKNAMAAEFFALQGDKIKDTQYFAKMVTASYKNREYGHTGQGFSYLWGGLGAGAGGPLAASAFFKQASWHLDLVRRCDGSFTYDGGEQYGPGKTADDTYYGNSSYDGLSPTASYVLTYSLPLKKICITGRDSNSKNWLTKSDVSDAIFSAEFDIARKSMTSDQLIAAFSDWSPVTRSWAAKELGNRPESVQLVPELIKLAEGTNAHKRQGAAEALGYINDPAALSVLAGLLTHEDRWLRVKAANSLKNMRGKAKPVIAEMLKAVVDTAEPVFPVVWEDPVQLTHGELAEALFGGLLKKSIVGIDPKLLYPAIQAVARNPDGMARATLTDVFEKLLTEEDVAALAPDLLTAIKIPCPADTMFSAVIRMSAFKALTRYHYKEAIDAGVVFAETQGGHGSESRTGEIVSEIASYGTAARSAIPDLIKLIESLNRQTKKGGFPADLNLRRTGDVQKAIDAIESATTEPALRKIAVVNKVPSDDIVKNNNKNYQSGTIAIITTPEGANLPSSASLDEFPLLIRLNKDWFDFKQTKPMGEDIRFTSSLGVQLNYQIEDWDSVEGVASIWVRIPNIKGDSVQIINMHWGKADAVSQSNGNAVFNESNGYLSVWHMSEGVKDEVGTLESKDEDTTSATGLIGKARHFAGDQGISCGKNIISYPVGSNPHTSQVWFRPEKSNGRLIAWGNEERQGKVVMKFGSPSHVNVGCYFSGADVSGKIAPVLGEWTQAVHSFENGDSRLYVNGLLDSESNEKSSPLKIASPSKMWIGGWYGEYDFHGDLDEVRISKVKRSADWVKLEYENQKPLQTVTGPIIQSGDDFSVSSPSVNLMEGQKVTLTAKAGGALKMYWILKSNGKETVLATDRFAFTIDAERVTGNSAFTLQCKVIYPNRVMTKDIAVAVTEDIQEPIFKLQAPEKWDGRSAIEVVPLVSNLNEMQQKKSGTLKIDWEVAGIAVGKKILTDRLKLTHAQNSGSMTVSCTISNGGKPTTQSVKLQVTEPKNDAWVARVPSNDEQPVDGQFYARDDKNEGTVFYNGKLTEAADSVYVKVYADGRIFNSQSLTPKSDRSYKFMIKLKPGLVKYKVELGSKTGSEFKIIRTVNDLVCGDAYLINGQSNAVATDWGKETFPETNEWIRSYGSTGNDPSSAEWGLAIRKSKGDRLAIGYWAFDLAKNLMEKYKLPICIINGAVGGTRIDLHQRSVDHDEDLETIYGRLLWRVRQAKLTHGVRGMFWHQGENDQGSDGPSGAYGWENYREYFVSLASAWKEDYPNIQHYYLFQIWPHSCGMGREGSDNRLREVQRQLPELFSNMSIMSTLGIEPAGGCHYPPAGYAEIAKIIAPLVEQYNYGMLPEGSITPPNLKSASYVSAARDEIVLEFDQPLKWEDSLSSQFYLDGAKGKISSGKSEGNKIMLKLTNPSSAQDVTYLNGETWSQKTILRGENGIAALTFCEVPIISTKGSGSD